MKRILLISGYDAASHRYWRELLAEQLSDYQWQQLALPDRYFYWRARGNALSIAYGHEDIINQHYDLLIVTSMVDLTALRGFAPNLAQIPTIVYFHENQFAYPVEESSNLVNIQLSSIYTALSADKVLFNSRYNLETFIRGMTELLARLPDEIPKGLVKRVQDKSQVLPVPLAADVSVHRTSANVTEEAQIVWNHRWEFDKQPEVFFSALTKLKESGQAFKLHVLGQSFRNKPKIFAEAEQEFAPEILTYGYQSRTDYLDILKAADIVVSTSAHEFQGISMLEAIALGCIPITPDRLVYPEYVPDSLRYASDETVEQEAQNLADKLTEVMNSSPWDEADVSGYEGRVVLEDYRLLIEDMISKIE